MSRWLVRAAWTFAVATACSEEPVPVVPGTWYGDVGPMVRASLENANVEVHPV